MHKDWSLQCHFLVLKSGPPFLTVVERGSFSNPIIFYYFFLINILFSVTVINNHSLGSILNFTLLDLVKLTKVTNTVYAIETKKISVCRYDLFM